jgi:hypothetical protein
MSLTNQRLTLATNPWNVPAPELGMRTVWGSIALSGGALLLAIAFRYTDKPVELAVRSGCFLFSGGAAGYAIARSRSERDLDALRNSHAAIREEISGSVLEASAEYYAQNVAAMMSGADVPVAAIQAWFEREYGAESTPKPAEPVAEPPQPKPAEPIAAVTMAEPTATPAKPEIDWFDWRDLANTDVYPHVLILGGSGDGKTTLMEWIGRISSKGSIEVWTTKRKSSQWVNLPIYGVGRDFDAIAARYDATLTTMTDRFADLDAIGSAITILWDEISACVANVPRLSPSPFFRESREAKIRIIAAPHGGQVGSIGLQGESDVLASVCQIRLGDLAIAKAQTLRNRGDWSAEMLDQFLQLDRPCLVGDRPAIVPSLPDGWQIADELAADLNAVLDALENHPEGATVRTLQRSRECRARNLTAEKIRTALDGADAIEQWDQAGTTVYRLLAGSPVLAS